MTVKSRDTTVEGLIAYLQMLIELDENVQDMHVVFECVGPWKGTSHQFLNAQVLQLESSQ